MVSLVTPLADIALLRKRENEILIIHTEIKVKTLPINKIVLIQRYRLTILSAIWEPEPLPAPTHGL